MLLEAIQIMLENIRAERSGDWKGHLASQANMLPYFFCTNKQNYSRWLPVYLLEMLVDLPEELEAKFEAGEFTFRICPNASFNGIWTDMAVEKTVIRDSKSDSGIVGVTRRKGALLRWYLSRHIMGNYSEVVKHRAGLIHSEEDPVIKVSDSSLQKDEDDVKTLMNHIHSSMSNPFALDTDNEGVLINISTGLQATDEVKDSLLEAVETGKAKLESFVRSNLELGSNGNFYSPISRLKLKTFQSMTIPTKLSTRSEGIKRANVSPEKIFRRDLALAEFREDVTVEALMSHPIGSVPLSLFNEDCPLRKTNKSDLALYLESIADISDMDETTPSNVIYIRDGMAVLHSLSAETCTTFDDLVFKYVRGVISDMSIADIVIDVFDRYDVQHSIKETERKRRSRTLKSKTYSVNGSRPIPTWKDFMSVSANKTALLQFFSEAVPNVAKTYFRDEKMLYLSGCMKDPTQVMSVTNNEISCWPELQNTNEEADSRIIYHMMEIDKIPSSYKDPKRIIIKATDTDVLVLATYFFPQISNISEVWVAAGHVTKTVDKRRLIPVHRTVANSNPTLLNILPAVHALTGCDSVSSLYGIGKKSVMKILQDSGSVTYQNLSEIATDSNEETMVNIARPFVARLYDPKQYHTSKHSSLNKLRTAMSTTKDISLAKLPPFEDAFKFHVKRAAYQCKIWMNANKRNPVDESPLEHGWEEDNSGLAPIYFEGQMAVDILSKMYCSCSSKKPCSSKACICKAANLACIGNCGCSSTDKCGNQQYSEQE